jgi:hypothetical protein
MIGLPCLLATHPGGDVATVNTLRQAAWGASNRGAPDVAVTTSELLPSRRRRSSNCTVHELGKAALRAGELDGDRAAGGNGTLLMDGCAEAANALGWLSSHRPGGDDRSHGSHRRAAQQRAQGVCCGCRRARTAARAAWRSGAQATGAVHRHVPHPADVGERLPDRCRGVRRRGTGTARRHASWPCRRSRTGGCWKTQVGVGWVLDRADGAPARPRR